MVDLVDGQLYERLYDPAGPANLDAIHLFALAQAEVHSEIVLREIAAAAAHLLDLHQIAAYHPDHRPDPVPVADLAYGLKGDPVVALAAVVAQQKRPLIVVGDKSV